VSSLPIISHGGKGSGKDGHFNGGRKDPRTKGREKGAIKYGALSMVKEKKEGGPVTTIV